MLQQKYSYCSSIALSFSTLILANILSRTAPSWVFRHERSQATNERSTNTNELRQIFVDILQDRKHDLLLNEYNDMMHNQVNN
jgi:hypothetical protein